MRILLPILLTVWLAGCSSRRAGGPDLSALPTGSPAVAFKIAFGVTDTEPTRWDGSIEVASGAVAALTGWRFYKDDQILPDGKSWKCSTRRRAVVPPKMWWLGAKHEVPADPNAPPPPGPMLANGVFVTVDARPGVEIRVQTDGGNFSFTRPGAFLDGRVTVEAVAAPWKLTAGDGHEDDNPSVVIDANGRAVAA